MPNEIINNSANNQPATKSIFSSPDSEVQDIFSEAPSSPSMPTDSPAVQAPSVKPAAAPQENSSKNPSLSADFGGTQFISKKNLILIGGLAVILIVIIVVIAIIVGSMPGKKASTDQAPVKEVQTNTSVSPSVENSQTENNNKTVEPTKPVESQSAEISADTDSDGLTDDEEVKLGTSKEIADTDNDGLSDREEVKVYSTNPFNADTDSDGYLDGEEVKNGYNPNGNGKLYELPKPIE